MPEKLNQAFDALSDQTKKFELALFFTRGDQEKARDMVSGVFKDLYLIKVKFSTSSNFGAFLMFFSVPYCMLINSYSIVSSSYEIDELKTSIGWKEFEAQIEKLLKKGKTDYDLIRRLKDSLNQVFSIQLSTMQRSIELKQNIEANDQIAINRLISKFIEDKIGYQIVSIAVDYESITSLDMELHSISSRKVSPEDIKRMKDEIKAREDSRVKVDVEEDKELSGKDVKIVLNGEIILAPIKGKDIASVTAGEKIKVHLDSSNPRDVSVAKAFKYYDENEGRILPVPAVVVSKNRIPDGGYKIFCLIAKGIYVKIVEEEDNIKIAMDYSESQAAEESAANTPQSKIQMIMIYVIVVLIIIGLAIIIFI
jgi:hypothetical protein